MPESKEVFCSVHGWTFCRKGGGVVALFQTFFRKSLLEFVPLRPENRLQTRRHTEKYIVEPANTEILKNSSIPHMQRILNTHDQEILKWMKFTD